MLETHLILADSEVELVPQPIQGHPSVVSYAKRRGKKPSKVLLDASFHHSAIRVKYPSEVNRRGRPDIAYFFLNVALESPLNRGGYLRVYVHTRNNEVIFISPSTRIPKAYHRFIGLIEHLFNNGNVPDSKNPLLWIENLRLDSLVQKKICPDRTIVLHPRGKKIRLKELFEDVSGKIAVIIGGFPEGDYISNIENISDEIVSIYPEELVSWVVAYEIISEIERRLGIM